MNFHYLLYNIQIIFFFLVELSFSAHASLKMTPLR